MMGRFTLQLHQGNRPLAVFVYDVVDGMENIHKPAMTELMKW
jgi:hypothetical protein